MENELKAQVEVLEELLKEKRFRIRTLNARIKELKRTVEERDGEIWKHEKKIDEQRHIIDSLPGGWMTASYDDEDIPELPLPRFEVRWYQFFRTQKEDDWSSYHVISQLVYKHLLGHIVSVPFGHSTIRGFAADRRPWEMVPGYPPEGPYTVGGHKASPSRTCDLPSRLGADMFHDASHFGLPIYAVMPDDTYRRLDAGSMMEYYQHPVIRGRSHRRETE